jgi:hypothetical protein
LGFCGKNGSEPTLASGVGEFGEVALHAASRDAEGFVVELQARDLPGLDKLEDEGVIHTQEFGDLAHGIGLFNVTC